MNKVKEISAMMWWNNLKPWEMKEYTEKYVRENGESMKNWILRVNSAEIDIEASKCGF